MTKKMITNTKQFMAKVQATILSHFDNMESLQNEMQHYFKNYGYGYADTMVQYGCFDCYYSQCAESMANWFNCTVGDVWTYYKDNEQKLWQYYKHFICRELNHIRNGRIYVK